MRKIFWNSRTELARLRQGGVGLERHQVKGAQAHGQFNFVPAGANAGNDVTEDARSVLERAAVFARPGEGAEELVEQITVAVLDVHEISPNIPGDFCRSDVILDQVLNRLIRP